MAQVPVVDGCLQFVAAAQQVAERAGEPGLKPGEDRPEPILGQVESAEQLGRDEVAKGGVDREPGGGVE